jgi:hypothetical protein
VQILPRVYRLCYLPKKVLIRSTNPCVAEPSTRGQRGKAAWSFRTLLREVLFTNSTPIVRSGISMLTGHVLDTNERSYLSDREWLSPTIWYRGGLGREPKQIITLGRWGKKKESIGLACLPDKDPCCRYRWRYCNLFMSPAGAGRARCSYLRIVIKTSRLPVCL